MIDFANIENPAQYAGKWVAFRVEGENATVLMQADTLGDMINANGTISQKGLTTLCQESNISDYIPHYFSNL
jgi:hypothetical protein